MINFSASRAMATVVIIGVNSFVQPKLLLGLTLLDNTHGTSLNMRSCYVLLNATEVVTTQQFDVL